MDNLRTQGWEQRGLHRDRTGKFEMRAYSGSFIDLCLGEGHLQSIDFC